MNQGLIGNWSPGIGDPSVGGWLTVLLYVIAAWTVWRLLQGWDVRRTGKRQNERWFWRALFVALVLLSINKQLDLQSALTELGRIVAEKQGWYENRRQVQMAFIAGIALMGMTLMALTFNLTWGAPTATLWALLGTTWLIVFVVVRAASFHHIDALLGHSAGGLRINWLLEMSGLVVIIASARRRMRHQ